MSSFSYFGNQQVPSVGRNEEKKKRLFMAGQRGQNKYIYQRVQRLKMKLKKKDSTIYNAYYYMNMNHMFKIHKKGSWAKDIHDTR